MAQQGDSWQIRIDPLSIRAVALRVGVVALGVACLIAGGSRAWVWSPLLVMLLAESSMLQIVVSNGVLTIRSWPDRWSGRLGIVRTLGPQHTLVFRADGMARLVGPDPTAVPLPQGSLLRGWYKRKLTEACRRAGAGIVDQTGDWLRDHPLRSRIRSWSYRIAAISLTLAVLVTFGAPAVAHDAAAWYGIEVALLVLGYVLALTGYVAGPPDYRKFWTAVSSR